MIAFVAASPSIDRTQVVDALTPGEIHRPEHVVAVPGGKALNAQVPGGGRLGPRP